MPTRWNETDERRLLLCIIGKNATAPDWDGVSTVMAGFSAEACRWNPESERLLLLLAVTESDHKPSQQIWATVAQKIGGGLNANAVSQKFNKLKKESEALLAASGAPGAAAASPSTPGSLKSTKSTTGKRGRKKNGEANGVAADDDDHHAEGTPSKKARVKKEVEVKKENVAASVLALAAASREVNGEKAGDAEDENEEEAEA